jgi:hypothetical protein
MTRAIITGSEGSHHKQIASITAPKMQSYAALHGVEFGEYELLASIKRPPAWKKLPCMARALSIHDEVLWLDADVVVCDSSQNIFDLVGGDFIQAMVCHETSEGSVPNTGVWLVRRAMLPFLMRAAMDDQSVNHRWWEQAAIHRLMGFSESSGLSAIEEPEPLYYWTRWLDESWNVWQESPAGIKPRFRHACGLDGENRLRTIKEWADAAT